MLKPSLVVSLAVGTVMLLWRFLGSNNNETGEEGDDLVRTDTARAFLHISTPLLQPGQPRLSTG